MVGLTIATEDELSEAVAQRLVADMQPALHVAQTLRRNGFGYLRSKMSSWCELARNQPVFLLTDLDMKSCPAELVQQWRGGLNLPTNLVMRVAVREVEAWLLADHNAMRQLLGERGRLPGEPDTLTDPKQSLLQLAARYAPRDVREDLVQQSGAMSSQGIGYNARLVNWVQTCWRPELASDRSPSLRRARVRLQELAQRVQRS
jgi:hypothetical protein